MTNGRSEHEHGGPDPSAKHARPGAGGRAEDEPVEGPYDHPEAQLGGADAVEKTTYSVGRGAEPENVAGGRYGAREPGGLPVAAWLVAALAALIAIIYAIGVFR